IGGELQCKIWPMTEKDRGNLDAGDLERALEKERERLRADGIDPDQVLRTDDLVRGSDVSFAATGITSGELLGGVEYYGWGARTSSVMMRSHSGTIRYIQARHKWRKEVGSLGKTRIG